MFSPINLLAAEAMSVWYLVPLAVGISLVYSTSRFEMTDRIIRRAARLFATIVGFMLLVLIVLWGLAAAP